MLERATEEECEAVNAFFGWNYQPGDPMKIPLELFERELRESAFGIGLLELHQILEGFPLLTKDEQKQGSDRRWNSFFASVREEARAFLGKESEEWLDRLQHGQGAGSRTLRECYQSDPEMAASELGIVIRALEFLFGSGSVGASPPIRLPVLAARVSGDAHALDLNRPAGRLLLLYLRERLFGTGENEGSEADSVEREGSETLKIREIYRRFGILDDDLSAIVHWFIPETGKEALPVVWTLRQVDAAEKFFRCARIYAVENPAIFSAILDAAGPDIAFCKEPAALLCMNGPASAAAIRWIQRCLEASGPECRLFYSGDFDIQGLIMGQTLHRLFPEHFVPWRFGADTFRQVQGKPFPGPNFEKEELIRLEKMKVPWDDRLIGLMRKVGRKAHQESFAEELIGDFLSGVGCQPKNKHEADENG